MHPYPSTPPTPLRVRDLPESDRPRERLARLGPGALSGPELLAILLGGGTVDENAVQVGSRLLRDLGGLVGLHQAGFDTLLAQRGLGPARACQLLAAIELGRRIATPGAQTTLTITCPADAADLVRLEMSAFEQEHLRVIFLNTRNRVLGWEDVYRGTLNSVPTRIGEIFKQAIRKNAAGVILCHNHPSQDPTPSPDDVALTREVVRAGELLQIQVLDHLIIALGRFVSLKERGLGFDA